MSKERFFKGTFLLTSAGLISRIMGFFYRIFLSHTIGAEGIGLYQLVVPLQHLVLAMTTFGIQTALSRLISSHTALGEKKEAQEILNKREEEIAKGAEKWEEAANFAVKVINARKMLKQIDVYNLNLYY